MLTPGAPSVTNGARLEKDAICSTGGVAVVRCVAATLIAEETQAGDDSPVANASLPAATTGATPSVRSWSNMVLYAALVLSHVVVWSAPSPRLRLTDAMPSVAALRCTQSRAASRSSSKAPIALPDTVNTRSEAMLAPGATPCCGPVPEPGYAPAAMPATWVPCRHAVIEQGAPVPAPDVRDAPPPQSPWL